MSIDALGLLVRQSGNRSVKLLHRHLALIQLTRGHGNEKGIIFNSVSTIQGIMRLVVICTAAICGLHAVMLFHNSGYFIRNLNNIIGLIKIGILLPQIDLGHSFPPFQGLIPVIGTVKAGYGALAFEEDYGQEYARVKDPSNYFYLVVRGDSMEPRIQDGDLALVHKQDTLENGDLGVLVYGDEGEGTLKRYIQRGNCVVLQPFNPAYNELVIKGDDLNRLHIAGRVVETKAKW